MEGKNYPHYPDGRAMSIPEFYERMRGGAAAVTAAANVAELTEGMEVHLKAGKDVLFLCFSSGLSSTRDACAIAADELREKYPERKIYTVDTLAASAGQGLLVLLAGRRQRGPARHVRRGGSVVQAPYTVHYTGRRIGNQEEANM